MFGSSAARPSLFGNTNTANPQPQSNLFGASNAAPQPQSNLFGSAQSKPFGSTFSQPSSNIFGASQQQHPQAQQQQLSQQPPQQQGIFGNSTAQPQNNTFGLATQQQQQQSELLQYGRSTQTQSLQPQFQQSSTISPYRSIPAQIGQIYSRWNPNDISSPFRTYLYFNVEKEEEAFKYQPEPTDDINEWEKAVSKRPGPTYVPKLYRGFEGLAQRAKLQQQSLVECHTKLVEINNSLEVQMDRHKQFIATRLSEARRRHERISRRTLALAGKVQVLRNKGYVMDNAEEELKDKLSKLERVVLDPSLDGREQEIWARMIDIRDRSKLVKDEMERFVEQSNVGGDEADGQAPVLSEEMVEKANRVSLLIYLGAAGTACGISMLTSIFCNRYWKTTTRNCDICDSRSHGCRRSSRRGS